jgi:hypothetical protein
MWRPHTNMCGVQSEGGAAPGVAVSAALADLGRTKAWTSLVLDSLASRWLQQQVPMPFIVCQVPVNLNGVLSRYANAIRYKAATLRPNTTCYRV